MQTATVHMYARPRNGEEMESGQTTFPPSTPKTPNLILCCAHSPLTGIKSPVARREKYRPTVNHRKAKHNRFVYMLPLLPISRCATVSYTVRSLMRLALPRLFVNIFARQKVWPVQSKQVSTLHCRLAACFSKSNVNRR